MSDHTVCRWTLCFTARYTSTLFLCQDSNSVITVAVLNGLPHVRLTIDRCGAHLWRLQLPTVLGPLPWSPQP